MSHAGVILGISDLEVERVERDQSIRIYARPTRRPSCIHCKHDGVKIKATRQRVLKHTRQGNQLMTLHLRAPKYHCPQCDRYFCHRFKGVRLVSELLRRSVLRCSKRTMAASLNARSRAPTGSVGRSSRAGITVIASNDGPRCRTGLVHACWASMNTSSPVVGGMRPAL